MRYGNLELVVPADVYEPAEDSFLLAEYAGELQGRILDMGTGSGIAALANAKRNPGNEVVGIDINPRAVRCAEENAVKNNVQNARFIEGNLFENVEGVFDGILFNPPYLPTTKEERVRGALNDALDGGIDGREVLDRFLDRVTAYLRPGGILAVVQSSLNNPEETHRRMAALGRIRKYEESRFFFETLWIVETTKPVA